MTEIEKIIAGIANVKNYDISNDFDCDEIETLLEEGIIKATDLKSWRASDLIIDEVIGYDDYPFEKFPPDEQLRQLLYCAIEPSVFLEKADLDFYDADEWLFLLKLLPHLFEQAPWEMLKAEGSKENSKSVIPRNPPIQS